MLPLLRSRRERKLFVVAVVVSVGCVALGIWQLARLQQKRDFNRAVERGLASPPAPIERLLARADDPSQMRYRPAEATGTFDTDHELILYGRSQNGEPGNHVLTPLRLADQSVVLVDRGWVPFDLDTPPVRQAAPPPGSVTVSGVVFPSEGGPPGAPASGPAVTTLTRVDLGTVQAQVPYRIAPVYLLLQGQSPPQANLPLPAPLPELTEGPHLSYAIQWFSFAAIALIGFVVLVRRDRRASGVG
jgi:surfeit locus 1 family protein